MAGEMKFRRIRLRNWKNFRNADVEIPDRLFLVGPNGCGKSNFLDAFRFLKDLTSKGGGFEEAVGLRGGMRAIRCLAARRQTDVEIAVDVQEGGDGPLWSYRLVLGQNGDGRGPVRPYVLEECVSRADETILRRPDEEDMGDRERLTQTHMEQVSVNSRFRRLAEFFRSINSLNILHQPVHDPKGSVGLHDDPFGGDFLRSIDREPGDLRESRLKLIEQALRIAVPQFTDLEATHDEDGAPHLRAKFRHWRPQDAWQTEEQFSDGTLRLIRLLWVATTGRGPLLLEEPEISLHPGIVRVLPQMLARVRRPANNQTFLSTHSPELLRDEGIGLDETLLLLLKAESMEIAPAGSFSDVRNLLDGGISLDDIVIPKTEPSCSDRLSWIADF